MGRLIWLMPEGSCKLPTIETLPLEYLVPFFVFCFFRDACTTLIPFSIRSYLPRHLTQLTLLHRLYRILPCKSYARQLRHLTISELNALLTRPNVQYTSN